MNPVHDSQTVHQNSEEVRNFFEQWAVYRKVVENNYLFHREAYAALGGVLKERGDYFSFLELGCGDADYSSAMLAGFKLSYYEAVDLSVNALELAEKNLQRLRCVRKLAQGDFFSHVRELNESFDVVFIGLSLHHLPKHDKAEFFRELRRVLKPGGAFFFYEPVMNPGESREEVMRRFAEYTKTWTVLGAEEIGHIHKHVFENDYPETVEDFSALAAAAGFSGTRVLFEDPEKLYAVFECGVPGYK